jgi:hypothetical protein
MAILQKTGGSKSFYTREDDEAIVELKKEGKSNAEIAKLIGRTVNSVTYRIGRVLCSDAYTSLDEIKYKA